jgi:WD40 repeat protein
MLHRVRKAWRGTAFYVTGGTLDRDAPSYVARQADEQLYAALTQGRFCYVLTSRQMGKSSLMVRTAGRLREEGATVAVLDLTAIGQNLTAEQWYDGLLSRIGQQLGLEVELEEFWVGHDRLGPLQRLMRAIRDVVLARSAAPVVIFVDEIDAVRSLPFSTDEFFAGIREFYNRRSEDPELQRLTFCLLGVATPSDLIRDTRVTPFNIGERIELHDFTGQEAAPLAEGLGHDRELNALLLSRVLYWTGGHPYLTQRLCRAVAEDPGIYGPGGVDRLCGELFLSARARERDDNLLFVRERLLRGDVDPAGVLELYARVRKGERVPDDSASPLVSALRLSGITRSRSGHLRVRNRIYRRVFDLDWVRANMPNAELRRQRAAYRKGQLRAAVVAAVVGLVGLVTLDALQQRHRAEQQAAVSRRLQYATDLRLAQRAWDDGNYELVLELLDGQRPEAGREDLRGFEWYYLWRLCNREGPVSLRQEGEARAASFSPDGRTLAVGTAEKSVKLWDVAERREVASLAGHTGGLWAAVFSPDGRVLATGSDDRTVKLWDVGGRGEIATLAGHGSGVNAVAFSPDGSLLAAGSEDGVVTLWDVARVRQVTTLTGHADSIWSAAFSPDGSRLVTASDDKTARIWSAATGEELLVLRGSLLPVTAALFTPDGRRVVTAGWDKTIRLWDAATGTELATLAGHRAAIYALAISPDGKRLASGSTDTTARLWDLDSHAELALFRGHIRDIWSVAFSPDGRLVASASRDGTVKLWDASAETRLAQKFVQMPGGDRAWVRSLAFSLDGATLVVGHEDASVTVWDVERKQLRTSVQGAGEIRAVRLAEDGSKLVAGSSDFWSATWWDASAGAGLGTTRAHANPDRPRAAGCGFAISPDGRVAATGQVDGAVTLWDTATGGEIATLAGHQKRTRALAFAPSGALLATGSNDLAVKLWDLATGRERATFHGHTGDVADVAVSPDGELVASASLDRTARLWDPATGRVAHILKGHSSGVWALAFSPDGKRLATAGDDNLVKLWDVVSGQELLTLQVVADRLTFSPDGRFLATGDRHGAVKLWEAEKQF